MEEIYKINPTNVQFNPFQPEEESSKFNYVAVLGIVVFLVIISYFIYTGFFQKQNQEESQEENKKIYTEEEKLQILSFISESISDEVMPVEEKHEILKQVSEKSQASQEKQFSKEDKLNILYSLQ